MQDLTPSIRVPGDPQTLNRYSYVLNNPLIYIDPSGNVSLDGLLKSLVSGAVGGAVFVLSGGTASPIVAGILAGMAAGATSAALNGGGLQQVVQGAVIGGTVGGITGGLFIANVPGEVLLGAGAVVATATGGLDGLAYYAGGVVGGLAGYGGASYAKANWNNWFGEYDMGGTGNCTRCMPENVAPTGKISQLDYHSLFEGDERITSNYGMRKIGGVSEFHGGIDVATKPNKGFGTSLLAPSGGAITRITAGGIFFRPNGFSNSLLFFYHISLSPNLAGTPLPIQIQAGNAIGVLSNVGRVYGAHVHIQLESGGKLFNPRFVFP